MEAVLIISEHKNNEYRAIYANKNALKHLSIDSNNELLDIIIQINMTSIDTNKCISVFNKNKLQLNFKNRTIDNISLEEITLSNNKRFYALTYSLEKSQSDKAIHQNLHDLSNKLLEISFGFQILHKPYQPNQDDTYNLINDSILEAQEIIKKIKDMS